MNIKAERWPWQKQYHPFGRFGGGWNYKLGIDIGGSTIIINLLFGLVRIKFR